MSAFLDNTQINYIFSSSPFSFSSIYLEKGGAQQKIEKPNPLFISVFLLWSLFWLRKRDMKCTDAILVIRLEKEYCFVIFADSVGCIDV